MAVKGFIGERFKVECPCGTVLYVVKSKKGTRKFCSKKCMNKYRTPPHKDNVYSNSYNAIHLWVHTHKTKSEKCEHCGISGVKLQWANKSHEYKRELDDWMELCIPCHRKHDLDADGMKRQDTKKFPELLNKKKRCGNRLLTKEQVEDIYTSLEPQKILNEKYNLSSGYVCMIKKGIRYRKYTKHLKKSIVKPMYIKLTYELAREIRESPLKGCDLAKKYSLSQTTISLIRSGKRWNQR